MGVADVNRLAIHYGQIVTQLVAHVAPISDDLHGAYKIAVVLISIASSLSVEHIKPSDRTVREALEFAAEVRQRLQWADVSRRLVNGVRASVRHEGSVEADLQRRRVHLADHAQHILVVVDDGPVILQG